MKMLSPALIGTIMYASMLILLCIGFTFTHMIEKFPNFAHTSYATIGTIFAYTFVRLWGYNPYFAWPFAALVSGFLGVVLYILVVQPIQRAGSGGIQLTFAMFALSYIIDTILGIFSFWVFKAFHFRTLGFLLRAYDFTLMGFPGILFTAPVTSITLIVVLHLFLTRTRFGIAIRATTEDAELASSLGVNTYHVHIASWFVTGALAGLAGAAFPLWYAVSLGGTDKLMVNVLAGSVLGGLDSIYGAIVGSVVLAYTQMLMPAHLARTFGTWIVGYVYLTPIIVIVGVQMLLPEGVVGVLNGSEGVAKRLRKAIESRLEADA